MSAATFSPCIIALPALGEPLFFARLDGELAQFLAGVARVIGLALALRDVGAGGVELRSRARSAA